MMASCSFTKDNSEECHFFDARDDALSSASISDSGSDFSESFGSDAKIDSLIYNKVSYDLWTQSPRSVEERRGKFLSWLGLRSDNSIDACSDVLVREIDDRIMGDSGAVLQNLGSGDEFFVSTSSFSYRSNSDQLEALDDFGQAGEPPIINEDFKDLQRKVEEESHQLEPKKRIKRGWLSRLRSLTCIVEREGEGDLVQDGSTQRVKVYHNKKKLKELSALYTGQDIKAHKGSILTMKFSLDGKYLASAGEDGIARLWQVVEDAPSNQMNIPYMDPSCLYFKLNHHSELTPFPVDEKNSKLKNMRKTSDSACVIFPPTVFRLLEKPVHEFHGHNGKILDLTWSSNNYLLSASVDKTVRLWKVGGDHCLKVFSHSDYVTCVQFNPVDEDYFISGSIDGKIRIWDIPSCQVVDWTEVKDIVTAVCYRPDAQVVIVGSMKGNCRFYNSSDNHLQLDTQICLQSKKKSQSKRITGFQFLPQDSSKVMVTCADSQVRFLDGVNVISKFRGPRNAGNNIFASLTSDGKHIVSACEDSNVYIWNSIGSKQTNSIQSYERFSTNASMAIPWCGIRNSSSENIWKVRVLEDNSPNTLPFSYPACFPLSKELCLESFPRGTATWPEEKLPTSSPLSALSSMRKSQYKFLKTSCQSISDSHAWGMVIVTAGRDGRIRSFHNYGLPVST